jgi:hypothetical protein
MNVAVCLAGVVGGRDERPNVFDYRAHHRQTANALAEAIMRAGAIKVLRRVIMSRRYVMPACRASSKIQYGSRAICLELRQNPK